MNYPDGEEVRIGDRVKLPNGELGRIVFSIDTDEYTEEFKKDDWKHLEKGVMVKTDTGALVHFEETNFNEILKAK